MERDRHETERTNTQIQQTCLNTSNITEIGATNNHWKTLSKTDYLTNYNTPPSVATDSGSEDGNRYPFLPTNPKTTSTGNIKETTSNTIIKRTKRSQTLTKFSEKLDEMLKPVKPTLHDAKSNFILNYCQFKCLLENACVTGNPIDIIKDYNQDSKALLHMIETIHPLLKDRCLKNRIRRLAKKKTQARRTTTAAINDFSTTVHSSNWFSDTFLHEIFPIFN